MTYLGLKALQNMLLIYIDGTPHPRLDDQAFLRVRYPRHRVGRVPEQVLHPCVRRRSQARVPVRCNLLHVETCDEGSFMTLSFNFILA